jgi:hypothetical protein
MLHARPRSLWIFPLALLAGACGQKSSATPGDDAGVADAAAGACPPCVTDQDCNGGVCAQLGSDSYCAATCPNGNECTADRACTPVSTVSGQQASACVPRGGVCGEAGGGDAGAAPSPCGTLIGPDQNAQCTSCGARSNCQANGCYGGWWCNSATNKCQAPPADCASGAGTGTPYDGGTPVTATVGGDGGTSSRLLFGIVGDTRPASIDDTAGYPTPIITKIFSTIDALPAKPPFLVSTGDYMFASTYKSEAGPQLDLYLGARAKYSGTTFAAMGNHECTGATASNCGPGSTDGTTSNYAAFLSKMLGPIGKTDPYYAIRVDAPDASWTCKIVFVAGNAWSDAQASWLDGQLATATTYTFVVRHEPSAANTAPGVTPSDQIIGAHPYTLMIVGHTHTYERSAGKQIIVGNGGAPLSGSKNYGFGMVSQRADGALDVDMIDYSTALADSLFHFALKADGSSAP